MEENKFKRTTVTAALPYANGGVHIGHLAGVYVPADIYVRYLRLKKQEVMFIGGSDEHGVPVTIRARKEGITVQEVVDRYHNLIKKSFEDFGISFDIYSRTTSKIHHKFASVARHGSAAARYDTRPRLGYPRTGRGSRRQGALRVV